MGLKAGNSSSPIILSLDLLDRPVPSGSVEWTGGAIDVPKFGLLPSVRPRPLSLLSSLAVHGTTLCGLLVVVPLLAPDTLSNYSIRPAPVDQLELRMPLFLHRPDEPEPAAAESERAPRRRQKVEPPAAKATVDRPKFQLPQLRPQQKTELTLLQPLPELKPEQTINARIPQIMQWSVVPKVRRPLKRFVMPGNTVRNAQVPQLEAVPVLEVPNKMPDVRDLRMTGGVVPDRAPALPVPRATTMPVRTFVPPRPVAATAPAGLDILQGDDVNIVAISPQPVNALESLKLPPGSQVASIHDVKRPETAQLGTSLSAEPKEGSVTARTEPGKGTGASESARGLGPNASETADNRGGNPRGAGRTGAGTSGTGTRNMGTSGAGTSGQLPGGLTISGGRGSGSQTGTGTGSNSAASLSLSGPLVPIRTEHPENRTFDVVVVQSSAAKDGSGAGLLSGSPIYTVYVPVLPNRNWVMQYCIPKENPIQGKQGIAIQLGNTAPVKAPYPRVTVVPPVGGSDNITLHGFITDTGVFRRLRVVVGEKLATELMVLPLLDRWVFRPATRDGRPIEIEIVLVIPRNRG